MSTFQKGLIVVTLTAAIGTAIFEAHQISQMTDQVQTLRQQQALNAEQIDQLTRERDAAAARLTTLQQEAERLRQTAAAAPKLRGDVARLRSEAQELARLKASDANSANDPVESAAKSWLARVNLLKERVAQRPAAQIPEFQFLTKDDWLNAAREDIGTDTDDRKVMSDLRRAAENKFVSLLQPALRQYMQANNSQFPTDLSQLQSFFESPVGDAVLQRWKIAPADEVPNVRIGGDWIVTQKSPVDEEYDSRLVVGPNGSGATRSSSRSK